MGGGVGIISHQKAYTTKKWASRLEIQKLRSLPLYKTIDI